MVALRHLTGIVLAVSAAAIAATPSTAQRSQADPHGSRRPARVARSCSDSSGMTSRSTTIVPA
jgi:hypothetical protein